MGRSGLGPGGNAAMSPLREAINEPDRGEPTDSGVLRIRYQELFEFAPDCQVVTDDRGIILEANHAASALLRCPKEFLVGKPLGLFVADGHRPRFYQGLTRILGAGGSNEFETRVGLRGEFRDVAMRAAVVEGEASRLPAFRWLVRDITEHRRAEAIRADLMHQLVTAQEDERRRVARELHDSVGQLLAALTMAVRAVRDVGPLPPPALARLDDAQRIADELGRTTHDLALRLRPTALDDLGLDVALRQYIGDWSKRTGVEVHFQAVGLGETRFHPDIETAFYRIVQEALTNVLKHADARLVSVVIERQGKTAIAVVEDDGVGFDPSGVAVGRRLGLRGIRERVALAGGDLEVESSHGVGTTVIARIPLHAAGPPARPVIDLV